MLTSTGRRETHLTFHERMCGSDPGSEKPLFHRFWPGLWPAHSAFRLCSQFLCHCNNCRDFLACVCVCVTLGIIGILSDFLAGGHGTRLQTVSNKAMQSGGISSLASWTYLHFSFFSAWHEAKPRTSLGRQVRPSSPCHFVVALRLWPPFLLRPPGFDGPYWYS